MLSTKALRTALASTALIVTAALSAVAAASPASAFTVVKGDRGPGAVTQAAGAAFMTAVVDGAGQVQFQGPQLTAGPSSGDGNGYQVAPGKVERISVGYTLQEKTTQGWQTVASAPQSVSVTAGGAAVPLTLGELPAPTDQYGNHTFRLVVDLTWYDGRYVLGNKVLVPSSFTVSPHDVDCETQGVKACSEADGALSISL